MATDPDVRIHIAQLDAFDPSIGIDWLTSDEASRLRAMTAPQRRRSFIAGHWLARHAAGEWLGLDPRQVAVRHHADGRPYLHVDAGPGNNIIDIMRSSGAVSEQQPPSFGSGSAGSSGPARSPHPISSKPSPDRLSLSISHSGNWLAVALASAPVGIDVELSDRRRNLEALARFAFSHDEAERLASLDESLRLAAFRQIWTLKEARGKRTGDGLRPEQSRGYTATPCNADTAEAIAWDFEGGSLALAVDAGASIQFVGLPEPEARTYWRF